MRKKNECKIMKKMLVYVLSAFCVLMFFTGCIQKEGNTTAATGVTSGENESNIHEKEDIKIASLKGPTSIGMVELMQRAKNSETEDNYEFTISAAADEFTADLLKGDIQIAALPCNAAAALYNKSNGKIRVFGINTLGVLYIIEKGTDIHTVNDLKGKTIYTTGKGTTPEYTLRYMLSKAGIDPDRDVDILFCSEASEVVTKMEKEGNGTVAMLPQPYVTSAMEKDAEIRKALDVTKEWEKISNDGSTVVTGVFVVNTDYYSSHKDSVDGFINECSKSADYVNSNVSNAASLVEEFGIFKSSIAQKAIPDCNITCITGNDAKNKIEKYLKVLYDENPQSIGGKMPDEDFYIY